MPNGCLLTCPVAATVCAAAGSDVCRADSYAGVVPVALTNASASTSEAVNGAPISGAGIDEASLATDQGKGPSDAHQSALEQVKLHLAVIRSHLSIASLKSLGAQRLWRLA